MTHSNEDMQRRIESAEVALVVYSEGKDEDRRDAFIDLLTDLRHLADYYEREEGEGEFDFPDLMSTANGHYKYEKQEAQVRQPQGY